LQLPAKCVAQHFVQTALGFSGEERDADRLDGFDFRRQVGEHREAPADVKAADDDLNSRVAKFPGQVGSPREVYEQPSNEFVARFIGVMNILESEVQGGVARVGELEFPAHGQADGQKLRIGFRPYAVQISSDLTQYRYRALLGRTFFLGVLLRVELELPSGLTIRARMTKEEYAHQGLEDGKEVTFQIRQYRVLARESSVLPPESEIPDQPRPSVGENI
jgi:hypothetical protein